MHKTPEGKVLLWDRQGKQHEQWPIDARAMLLEKGADEEPNYTAEPPEGVDLKLPPAPPRSVTIPKAPVARTFDAPPPADPEAAPPPKRKKKSADADAEPAPE